MLTSRDGSYAGKFDTNFWIIINFTIVDSSCISVKFLFINNSTLVMCKIEQLRHLSDNECFFVHLDLLDKSKMIKQMLDIRFVKILFLSNKSNLYRKEKTT